MKPEDCKNCDILRLEDGIYTCDLSDEPISELDNCPYDDIDDTLGEYDCLEDF